MRRDYLDIKHFTKIERTRNRKNRNDMIHNAGSLITGVHPHAHGSPVPPHDMELQLLKAGVHVFVEKPVSLQPPEKFLPYVGSVEEVQREKGLIVSVGYMFR